MGQEEEVKERKKEKKANLEKEINDRLALSFSSFFDSYLTWSVGRSVACPCKNEKIFISVFLSFLLYLQMSG